MSARRYPEVERRLRNASRAALAAGVLTLLLPDGPLRPRPTSSSPTSPRPPASTSSTRTPPHRASTCSRRWAAVWPCWTWTTTAGWTCSSPTARGSTIRSRPVSGRTNRSRRFWNRMYRQKEDGTFVDVTEKAGLSGAGDGNYGMGVAVGDYDNDGFDDLYVTSYGGNRLYRNTGNGTFADVTGQRRRRCRRLERERRVLRLRQRRQARSVRHPLSLMDLPEQPPLRGEEARLPRLLSPGQFRRCDEHPLSQQRERHVHRRLGEGGYR